MKQPFSFVNFVHPENDFKYFSGTWRPSLKRKKERQRRILRISGLLQAGSIRSRRTHQTTFHRHPKAYEIYYVASGRMEFLLGEEREQVSARGGQALIIPPGLPHATANENLLAQPAHYFWLVFADASKRKAFLNLDAEKTGSLFAEIAGASGDLLSPGKEIRVQFEKLIEALSGHSPLHDIEAISLSLQIFLSVLKKSGPRKREIPTHLKSLSKFIEENLDERLTPRHLAAKAGLSGRALVRAFREAFGMTPHDYILREKIRAGKRLLTGTALSVTEIAHRLGFSSSAHFATAFKQFTGRRPVDFRRSPKDN
ncbi:MAG: AraC family transcriptional regulator, partial [Spirochaetia bacterium]|nr:AraC family transcriptional regulator [Spirochaetia bacterium]